MTKKRLSSEAKIEHLRQQVEESDRESGYAAVKNALKDKSNFVVAKAAAWAGELLLYDLIPDLVLCYERFLVRPLESDKTCAAKKAIVKALYALDYDSAKFYRAGLSYRQLEPVWGGHVDTAVEVRCTCAFALASTDSPRVMIDLIELLHDEDYIARSAAIKAMELLVPYHAELVIRDKILHGDVEGPVMSQCFSSLVKVASEDALDFTARHLDHEKPALREAAALALGECRMEDALVILIEACDEALTQTSAYRKPLLQAIALHRNDKAYSYLLKLIESDDTNLGCEAIVALSIYNYNETLKRDIHLIIKNKSSEKLQRVFIEYWEK